MPIDRSEHGVIGNAAETDGTVSFNGIESTVTNLLWVHQVLCDVGHCLDFTVELGCKPTYT